MHGSVTAWLRLFYAFWLAGTWLVPTAAPASETGSADPPPVPASVAQAFQDRDYVAAIAAIAAIEAALAQPDQPGDYLRYLKGRALLLDGRFEAAVAVFEQMADQLPDSPWRRRARFAAALGWSAQQRFERAATIYRTEAESLLGRERKHELAETVRALGDAFFSPSKPSDSPDYVAALDYYQQALTVGLLPDVQAETEFRVARCRQELNQYDGAAELFTAFQVDYPANPLVIEAALRAGQCLLASGEPDRARRVWLDLLAAHREAPSSWIAETAFLLSQTWGMPRPASDADLRLGVEALEDYLVRFPNQDRAAQTHVDIALAWLTRSHPEIPLTDLLTRIPLTDLLTR